MSSDAQRIEAAKLRLRDLKAVHSRWFDGLDDRSESEILNEMEHIAFSAGCYLDGIPGAYLPADTTTKEPAHE